jgi:beta-phosphoglucomutase-like phosphatase (HAD superfamily)
MARAETAIFREHGFDFGPKEKQLARRDCWSCEVIVSADDVARAKPAPDLYLTACARLGAEPARSVAFEDSRTGVVSALAAQMFVVGVPSTPGGLLDAHVAYDSLAHAELRTWMASCTTRVYRG